MHKPHVHCLVSPNRLSCTIHSLLTMSAIVEDDVGLLPEVNERIATDGRKKETERRDETEKSAAQQQRAVDKKSMQTLEAERAALNAAIEGGDVNGRRFLLNKINNICDSFIDNADETTIDDVLKELQKLGQQPPAHIPILLGAKVLFLFALCSVI